MTGKPSDSIALWAPRILGIAAGLFLGLFAFDAETIADFLIHLAPAAVVLSAVVLSWRAEWIGAAMFLAFALIYAVSARDHLSWIAAIGLPLLAVSLTYFWSWTRHRRAATPTL